MSSTAPRSSPLGVLYFGFRWVSIKGMACCFNRPFSQSTFLGLQSVRYFRLCITLTSVSRASSNLFVKKVSISFRRESSTPVTPVHPVSFPFPFPFPFPIPFPPTPPWGKGVSFPPIPALVTAKGTLIQRVTQHAWFVSDTK